MSELETQKRIKSRAIEYKRKLIMLVKQHPSVWEDCHIQKHDAWKDIESKMNSHLTLKELQALWDTLRSLYFRKIFIRTIERNFEAPDWIYFHDMSFLYDIVKENIQYKLGGISPPLFKPKPNINGSQKSRCPCCLDVGPDANIEQDMSSMELKQEHEFENVATATSEISLENYQEIIDISESVDSVNSEKTQSICSLDEKESENQTCFMTNSPEPQQNEADSSLVQSSSEKVMEANTLEVIDLIDDDEDRRSQSLNPQLPSAILENVTDNNSSENMCPSLQKSHSVSEITSVDCGPNELTSSITTSDSRSITQPESFTVVQTQSPGLSETTSNGSLILKNNSDGTHNFYEQDNTQIELPLYQIRAIERSKIIEAIKANPATYLSTSNQKRTECTVAWNEVAKQVGNMPLATIKNRWRLIKVRYLKELVYERYSNGKKSLWESFDQLEFFRSHMQKDIIEIHRTRLEVQDTIRKKAAESCRSVQSNTEPFEPVIIEETKEIPQANNLEQSANDQAQFFNSDKSIVAYVNANQNIQITSVESIKPVKTYCRKLKPIENPVQLDENTMPMLQNRPITIKAVQVYPSLDLTNEVDKDESNDIADAPPAKKVRKSTDPEENDISRLANEIPKRPAPAKKNRKSKSFEKNDTNMLTNETPERLPSPTAPSFTLDLTADEATIEPATNPTSKLLQPQKFQKVFPPLDLTLDDDPPLAETPPAPKTTPPSKFQQVFVDEFVNTNKIFPILDLTTDEDKDEDKTENNDETETASTTQNGNGKDDENVIYLDDDSVSSYEEVIVYVAQQNKN